MGKKTVIICVALIVLAICAVCLWNQVYAILAIVAAVLAVLVFGLKSIDGTLERHPKLALMDGTEIVKMKEIEVMAAKYTPVIVGEPLIDEPGQTDSELEIPPLTDEESR